MNFVLTKEQETLKKGLAILLEERGHVYGEGGISITPVFTEENKLKIEKKGLDVTISCKEKAHFFRGLGYLFQHLEDADFVKEETVYTDCLGAMPDCSRNGVPTPDMLKRMIRTMALLGMNELFLYTEDTYELPEYPYFGAFRGRFTKEELKECDAYGEIFGIYLVPCIQTLAHLHNALKWPGKNQIKDSADILMVGKEETYVFIERLLEAVKDSFSTRRVHLGMDEAVLLGLGEYLNENGYEKGSVLVKEHCQRVLSICKRLGLEPMIWSDMYITVNTNGSYYTIPEDTDCSLWEKPEKGLGFVYWDYYHNEEKIYEKMLDVHSQLSDNVIFAGGSWVWNGIAPNHSKTFACTKAALQACKKYQIKEVFCTAWLDNGGETPVDAVLPGLVLFGHLGFHEEYDGKLLEEEFRSCTDGSLEDFMKLDAFDALFLKGACNQAAENPAKYLLYQDPMVGIFDNEVSTSETDTKAYYGKLKEQMAACQETSPAYAGLFAYYEKLAAVLADKADLGVRIKAAYDQKQHAALREICEKELPGIIKNLEAMKDLREDLWMADAKPFGYELMDIKLGGVLTRLDSTGKRIQKYLDGAIVRLEELEEKRLPYFEKNASKRENRWSQIISGCDLIDTI